MTDFISYILIKYFIVFKCILSFLFIISYFVNCNINSSDCHDYRDFTNEFAICLKNNNCNESVAKTVANKYGFEFIGQVLIDFM